MKKMPTISIVIPAYDEESQLGRCLDSIVSQSVAPDEVIVVDNNSTDATADIARSYSCVTLISETQQGCASARDAGFNAAQSDVLLKIDADTNLPADYIANLQQLADQLPVGDGMTGPCLFRETPVPTLLFCLHRLLFFWSSHLMLGHPTLFGSNYCMRRQTWLDIRHEVCAENTIHEDMDVSKHLVANGGQIHFNRGMVATISSRRWLNGWQYPRMWVKSLIVHGLY